MFLSIQSLFTAPDSRDGWASVSDAGGYGLMSSPWYTKIVNSGTLQLLYNIIVGVQTNFHASYPNRDILRVKCMGSLAKGVFNSYFGSNPDPCYIQNCVIMNCVIKRCRCTSCCLLGFQIYELGLVDPVFLVAELDLTNENCQHKWLVTSLTVIGIFLPVCFFDCIESLLSSASFLRLQKHSGIIEYKNL